MGNPTEDQLTILRKTYFSSAKIFVDKDILETDYHRTGFIRPLLFVVYQWKTNGLTSPKGTREGELSNGTKRLRVGPKTTKKLEEWVKWTKSASCAEPYVYNLDTCIMRMDDNPSEYMDISE